MFFKNYFYIFPALILLLTPAKVFAGDPPQLLSPSDGSTTSSSRMEWQMPNYTVCSTKDAFKVDVDTDPSFSYSSYYTKNTNYTPRLNPGTYFWRVAVRDETCNNWSSWSSIWSFNLISSSPTSTPTPSPSSTSSPTSDPSPSTSSSFIISNIPTQINSDQSFNVAVNLTLPNNPNTTFYLKGAFKKSDSSNYFGLTKVGNNWVKNGSSYSNQFKITTDSSGNWSGNLQMQPDGEDSGFTGTGDYIFKVARYTSSGSGPTWSNEQTLKIIAINLNTQEETNISSKSSPSPTSKASSDKSIVTKPTTSSNYQAASVAGAQEAASASPTIETEVKGENNSSPIIWIGAFLVVGGIGSLGYIYYRSRKSV